MSLPGHQLFYLWGGKTTKLKQENQPWKVCEAKLNAKQKQNSELINLFERKPNHRKKWLDISVLVHHPHTDTDSTRISVHITALKTLHPCKQAAEAVKIDITFLYFLLSESVVLKYESRPDIKLSGNLNAETIKWKSSN